jgi:hypothetical protein
LNVSNLRANPQGHAVPRVRINTARQPCQQPGKTAPKATLATIFSVTGLGFPRWFW